MASAVPTPPVSHAAAMSSRQKAVRDVRHSVAGRRMTTAVAQITEVWSSTSANSTARRAGTNRMQRKVQQIEICAGNDPAKQCLVAPQQEPAGDADGDVGRADRDNCPSRALANDWSATSETRSLHEVDDQPDDRGHRQCRQQQIEGCWTGVGQRSQRKKQNAPRGRHDEYQRRRGEQKCGRLPGTPAKIDQGSGAEKQRDRKHSRHRRPRTVAPFAARCCQNFPRNFGLEQHATAGNRNDEAERLFGNRGDHDSPYLNRHERGR